MNAASEIARQHEAWRQAKERLGKPPILQARDRINELEDLIKQRDAAIELVASKIKAKDKEIEDLKCSLRDRTKEVRSLKDEIGARASISGGIKDATEVKAIICHVLKHYPGVAWADIISHRRTAGLMQPRQVAQALVYKLRPDLGLAEVARIFRRDRKTIYYSIKIARERGWVE